MPLAQEFVRFVNLSYGDKNALAERMALDRTSVVYSQLRSNLASKLVLMKKNNEEQAKNNGRRKLVIVQTMTPEQSHNLMKDFAEFDFVFRGSERIEGGYPTAVFQVAVEKLFNFTRGRWNKIACFGFSMNHLVIHNRTYSHLCVPNESIESMKRTVTDDRAMCAILSAGSAAKKPFPLMQRYRDGELGDMACGDPTSCRFEAKIGVVMLTHVDTNYLQLCSWMMAHNTSILYFAFPCNKATEMGFNGPIPELDAYVKHEGDKFHILYKNATSMAQTYTRSNHLTLIAKTYEKIGDYTFGKEFLINQMGISFYKITRAKTEDPGKDLVYRSWMAKGYKSRYLVKSFELKNDLADPYRPESYKPFNFEVEASHIDKLIQDGMRLPDDAFDHMAIARKLRTYATTHVQAGYSIASCGFVFDERQFQHIVLLVYTHCFMERYVQGVTAAYVGNDTKKLKELSSKGMMSLVPLVLRSIVVDNLKVALSGLKSILISVYDRFFLSRVPIPKFEMACEYISYSDSLTPVKFLSAGSWSKLLERPWSTFSPYLPGYEAAIAYGGYAGQLHKYNQWGLRELRAILEYKAIGGRPPVALATSVMSTPSLRSRTSSGWRGAPTVAECFEHAGTSTDSHLLLRIDEALRDSTVVLPMTQVPIERGPVSDDPSVLALAAKVVGDGDNLMDLRSQEYTRSAPLVQPDAFVDFHNGLDPDPMNTLKIELGLIFPGSTLMDTQDAGGQILNADFHMLARAARIKITSSKLQPNKADVVYKPQMPNQLLPNAKQILPSTLHTVVKRNLNVMSSVDALDTDELWDRTWRFMKSVYYVDDIDTRLAQMDFIGPTVEAAQVWATKLETAQRVNALQPSYALETLDGVMQDSALMLKAKRKPNMGPSFDVAIKASQSIQYDRSRVRTGVFSPLFSEKVRRDQSLLKDNVFIMQSKSPDDLNAFLSKYSSKTNHKGELSYIMLDAEMFDKSQVFSTLMMHWKKCEVLKVLPKYLQLLKDNNGQRTAASVTAGVKIYITPQRGSGDSDTLDGNCDVSQAAYARFFHKISSQIEFILIMGDDVTVAIRGAVDTQDVESDCMKEFNLSVKLTQSQYGDFISGWLVHLPDGSIRWCTDPLKRAVALGEQSVSGETDFREKWEGYRDLCKGLEGLAVQSYLSQAISQKYTREFGHLVTPTGVLAVVKAVVSVAADFNKFRSFYAADTTKRY